MQRGWTGSTWRYAAAQELLERSLTAELEVPKSNRQDRQLEKNKTKFSNLLGTRVTKTIHAPRGGGF